MPQQSRLQRAALIFLFACGSAAAQQGNPPPRIDVATVTGANAATAQAVDRILREHHDKMEALRNDTDGKLSKLLTPAQLDKLHEAMRQNHRADGPPRG